jgi:hypothetical protein
MIKELKGEEFRRLTGVKRETFEIMLEELKKNLSDKEEKWKANEIKSGR